MALPLLLVDHIPLEVASDATLLAAIPEIPTNGLAERWSAAGITWQPTPQTALSGGAASACDPASPSNPNYACTPAITQLAFWLYDAFNASYLDTEVGYADALMDERWAIRISAAFAKELLDGVLSASGRSLSANAHAPAQRAFAAGSVTMLQGIGILEDDLARTIGNARGILHIPPALFNHAVTQATVRERDGRWYTPRGNLVVSDAGYVDAKEPTGQAASAAMKDWVYASGPVRFAATGAETLGNAANEYSDMTRNRFVRWKQGYGILQFDPAPVTAVLVDY